MKYDCANPRGIRKHFPVLLHGTGMRGFAREERAGYDRTVFASLKYSLKTEFNKETF